MWVLLDQSERAGRKERGKGEREGKKSRKKRKMEGERKWVEERKERRVERWRKGQKEGREGRDKEGGKQRSKEGWNFPSTSDSGQGRALGLLPALVCDLHCWLPGSQAVSLRLELYCWLS